MSPEEHENCANVLHERDDAIKALESEAASLRKQRDELFLTNGKLALKLDLDAATTAEAASLRAQLSASEAALTEAKEDLAASKVTAEFWLAHEKAQNNEFEQQYMAIWKADKKPDMTVLESVLAMKADLTAALAREAALREALEKMLDATHHWNGEAVGSNHYFILEDARTAARQALAEPEAPKP